MALFSVFFFVEDVKRFWQAHNWITNLPNYVGKQVNARQIRIKPGKYNIKFLAITVSLVNIVMVNRDLIVFSSIGEHVNISFY